MGRHNAATLYKDLVYSALQKEQFTVLAELTDVIPPAGWRAGDPLRVADAVARAISGPIYHGPSRNGDCGG